MMTWRSGLLWSTPTFLVSFGAWNEAFCSGFTIPGMPSCDVLAGATTYWILFFSSAITRDSAKQEPAVVQSMERLWSPAMVITPFGPGIFIFR